MESLPVTLIVKAPNQQVEDQTVQCELSWTIHKLKQHLSEVYPSKPPKHEQKLIYSGKLLNDTLVLKDVLRQYEGQDTDTHTLHLVCTPKYSPVPNKPVSTTAQPSAPDLTTNNTTAENANQRVPPHNFHFNQYNFNQQNLQNVDPYTMQVLMMQQAYMQYLSQYMTFAQQNLNANINQNQPQVQQPVVQQRNAPQQNMEPQGDAVGAQARDPELNRDWLDVFYMLSRVIIFISIVYFYSSPWRCIFVIALSLILYFYQIGFFRNANINNNNIVQGGTAEPQAPTRFTMIWTFFSTFFASLFPEIPNVV